MMEWLNEIPLFLLILVRISCFFITVPVFMTKTIPAPFKIGLAFFLAVIVTMSTDKSGIQAFSAEYIILIIKESLVGLGLGFIASILFYAIQLAGTFIDLQSGFAMGAVFDPQSGTNVNLTGRLKNVLATLFLFSLDGHHLLIRGVLESYQWIHVEALVPAMLDGRISTLLLETFKHSFVIAFLLAAPIVFTLFLVDLVLGIIGKTSPQINLMVVGFSLKIGVYFMVLFLALPGFFLLLHRLFAQMFDAISQMIRIMGASL
ncbi:flagellar biosynthetic protein FliR [Neobacillus soli]|uniref:flagellar biosynthetic protein FliR n=1 Tax=Neobacillus soli TaxID=220688 RepID=UPI00082443E4|nr:flagellar biosynthetic protein FliR [Neobacillus soli]